ncbi:MAG: TonB C-terminal domain-containing protein [Sandaracinaceae bacterium]|nr:TonB C-terminal domain-containing protein [Sandaracinaceae bacterium]
MTLAHREVDWKTVGGAGDPIEMFSGVGLSLAVNIGIPVLLAGGVAWLRGQGIELSLLESKAPKKPPLIENVVQARFVQLGRPSDRHRLPDRLAPVLRTAPPEPRALPSLREDPPPPIKRNLEPRPRDAVEDILRRLSQDAQQLAERVEARERVGSPDGIEEGREKEATPGDLYRGRLWAFFRRGWAVPSTIPDAVLKRLVTVAVVDIGMDAEIKAFQITHPSGHPDFDESVRAQLQRLIESQGHIPPPPEEVADQYLGRSITLNFRGRDAHR